MGDIYHGLHDIAVETTEEDLAEIRWLKEKWCGQGKVTVVVIVSVF
jgi:hypothetical protein